MPSKVSLEVEILEEGFVGGKHARKRRSKRAIPIGKRPRTRSVSQKEQKSLKSEQSLGKSSAIPTREHTAAISHQETPLPHNEKDILEQS